MSLKSKLSVIAAVATALVLVPAMAFAEDAGANRWEANKWVAASAGFAIGIAALGGTIGQSRAAAAALEGISRNPGGPPIAWFKDPAGNILAVLELG